MSLTQLLAVVESTQSNQKKSGQLSGWFVRSVTESPLWRLASTGLPSSGLGL
ncbi:MAG: hypothetical protein HXY43_12240 [Fischerella sp.]|jgi:hypothetical protein|uniref:hypothetical protein n=1 Tax=Fischerella sp. TaxID=1191 RepID=UPI00178DDB6B|nr:hypothetical protein [Fischerella sp.]NWF60014.1 hypothetical protein [Fischerella sp.]